MVETKVVKGTILKTLIWKGLVLMPKTKFDFLLTLDEYNSLSKNVVDFETSFNNVVKDNEIENLKIENEEVKAEESLIQSPIQGNETNLEVENEENVINEEEMVLQLLDKREKIEEAKEIEKEKEYQKNQINKSRPIPSGLVKTKK